MARIDASAGLDQPAFTTLTGLLADPRFWVKVSAVDRVSRQGPPYADAIPFARRLVADFADRVLWGTDFPHPNHAGAVPDDALLVDLIAEIAPSEALRRQLLVSNPDRLYRFAKALDP
jgi:2-pyrone-4,6-dicarboxylate lactonase